MLARPLGDNDVGSAIWMIQWRPTGIFSISRWASIRLDKKRIEHLSVKIEIINGDHTNVVAYLNSNIIAFLANIVSSSARYARLTGGRSNNTCLPLSVRRPYTSFTKTIALKAKIHRKQKCEQINFNPNQLTFNHN